MPRGDIERLLAMHRIMAIATVRPDGWPQNTIVGFAARGTSVYFMIFRQSQKFSNIEREPRIALAIGSEPRGMIDLRAIYAGAFAREVKSQAERLEAWTLLERTHPNLASYAPDFQGAAIMRADLQHVSLVDYSKGLGHTEQFTLDVAQGAENVSGTKIRVEPGPKEASKRSRS